MCVLLFCVFMYLVIRVEHHTTTTTTTTNRCYIVHFMLKLLCWPTTCFSFASPVIFGIISFLRSLYQKSFSLLLLLLFVFASLWTTKSSIFLSQNKLPATINSLNCWFDGNANFKHPRIESDRQKLKLCVQFFLMAKGAYFSVFAVLAFYLTTNCVFVYFNSKGWKILCRNHWKIPLEQIVAQHQFNSQIFMCVWCVFSQSFSQFVLTFLYFFSLAFRFFVWTKLISSFRLTRTFTVYFSP